MRENDTHNDLKKKRVLVVRKDELYARVDTGQARECTAA